MAVRSIPVAIILGEILFLVAFRIVSTCLPDLVGMRITNALAYGTYLVCPMVAALIAGNRKVLTAVLTGALCVATGRAQFLRSTGIQLKIFARKLVASFVCDL